MFERGAFTLASRASNLAYKVSDHAMLSDYVYNDFELLASRSLTGKMLSF